MNIYTRKIVSVFSIAVLAFVVVYCVLTDKREAEVNAIVTSLIGFLGYYFGQRAMVNDDEER